MSLSDVELMLAVKDGSTDAFTELVARHHGRLINFFFRSLWDRSLCEDLAQEVFLRVYRAADHYEPSAKFTTFLYRVAKNILIDHFRSTGNQPTVMSLFGGGSSGGTDTGDDAAQLVDCIESETVSPDAGLVATELEALIMQAVEQLSLEHRMVFVMSEIDGMKYQDIAEALEIPVGTVKSRMHTAFSRLRDLLKDLAPYAEAEPSVARVPISSLFGAPTTPDPPTRLKKVD